MARIGRCQSVIIGNNTYYYGEKIPYVRWKTIDDKENEIWDAEICAVSGIRENNVLLDGKDSNDNALVVTIDMDNVIE